MGKSIVELIAKESNAATIRCKQGGVQGQSLLSKMVSSRLFSYTLG
jgi:hypothetical protein